ncbi:hypothetical protein BJF79_20485 [Actinomadura sp. CNU-125]|nr:hypothetical protein BJF79_20485 [Actinomadura sp. CNU-125]
MQGHGAEAGEGGGDRAAGGGEDGVGEAAGEDDPAGFERDAAAREGVGGEREGLGGVALDGRAGGGVDLLAVDLQAAGFGGQVEVGGVAPAVADDVAGGRGVVRDDVGERELEVGVAAVDDFESGATRATAASADAAVTSGPARRSPMMKTISGSTRGWIRPSMWSGAPGGSGMSSVSQAVSGESMPMRSCLGAEVRPSLTPTTRRPSATLRRSTSSWTR